MHNEDRAALEALIAADTRALTAESDQIGHHFAGLHTLTANDFRALLHVTVAENAGAPLTAGELRSRMGMSGAAITYLVERMIASGHLLRDSHPADRRKVMLRVADHGMEVARDFFTPLADHTRDALAGLPDGDLTAAHRVFAALIEALGAFRAQLDGPLEHGVTHRAPGSGRVDGR
ncbi:MarR family winged helix-turn-helix transcriptional regulator [Mycolicibacterium pyrenivorans]|uniref:MarR family winged helix-turn-helix transcriptional regulator n=1 Tax=Mycolicibacterium pyrenivorans TaxID=187102 RepID=UPI0021F39B82|nr:MarR family winged helix-turn-helix transcriptional regulator [Mycolicibacterium pyrenivorans]MCV7155196.1 winged helix-turn-helix transcriptional regulator [Mycolicibacterium pyrenivorans]